MAEPDDTPEPEAAEGATPNAADPAALNEQRRRSKRVTEKSADFWRRVLADETGRREIWALLEQASVFTERFECGPNGFPQPEASWYRAGERDFALRLYRMLLRIDHEGVHRMHAECDSYFAKPQRPRKSESGD